MTSSKKIKPAKPHNPFAAARSIAKERSDESFARLGEIYSHIESPIERAFFAAFIERSFFGGVSDVLIVSSDTTCPVMLLTEGGCGTEETTVSVQHKIGKYTADFAITVRFPLKTEPSDFINVVVECDGHDYHERTKEQAAHDKKRDIEMTMLGWSVVRFTGSQIHKDAAGCANGVLELVSKRVFERVDRFNHVHAALAGRRT